MKKIFIIGLCLLGPFAHAKKFRNSYIEFELPPRWTCQSEHTEWICRNSIIKKELKKQAVIIFTAKEVGVEDTIANYKEHLNKVKMIQGPKGKPLSSTVKNVKETKINGQIWVDGFHLNSEVPLYFTRYLATIKQSIAVLVTFSAHQRYYTKYVNDFAKSIRSLRIIASGDLLQGSSGTSSDGGVLGSGFGGLGLDALEDEFPEEPMGSSGIGQKILILAILLIIIGAYFAFFRRKKKRRR